MFYFFKKKISNIKISVLNFYKKCMSYIFNDKTIVLIYTMGKVGSSTVYNSLKKKNLYSKIFHAHFLSANWLENILPKSDKLFHNNIKIGTDILNFIKEHPNYRIKVITLVREPIMRSVSDLFQNWKHLYNDIEQIDKEKLKNHLEQLNHDYTLNWFDTEFKEFLNIDLYDLPFNREKGYEIYKFKDIDILCIKLEALTEKGNLAIKEFLNKDIVLEPANKTMDKKGNSHYRYLKENLKINKDELLKIYNSKYVTHFYSQEEIKGFIAKWSK